MTYWLNIPAQTTRLAIYLPIDAGSGRSNLEFINLGMANDLGPLEASRLQRGPTGRHKSAQRRPIAQPELSVNLVKMNFYRSLGQIELLT